MSSQKVQRAQSLAMALIVPSTLLSSCGVITVMDREKELEKKKAELELRMTARGKIVYAIKDIPEGETIKEEALEEKEIEQSKIPQDALTSSSLCVNRIAKYGIYQGQIVSQHDLAAQGEGSTVVSVTLSQTARKKLNDIANKKNTSARDLAKQWIEEKLNSISQ